MCGICGQTSAKGVSQEEIGRMNHAIRHRGPDDFGIYVSADGKTGLGHRRLSIIDLAGGRQPMSNEDETLWITFNGEIYNYRELKSRLEMRHRFKTQSDTEVILHLYEDEGKACLQSLRGMFAFAIYDCRKNEIFMARDRLGQKPLYYYHDDDEFAFASEIKALLALKPQLRELNCDALYEYFTLRIITAPRSMFRRIRKLPPGHFLLYADGHVLIERYWELRYEPKLKIPFEEILPELERRVEETVACHMVSDVPVGAFLSGGVDSSLIVAMMSKFAPSCFKTFSGDVAYANYSEIPYARMVAELYKTDHHELTIHPSLVRYMSNLVWYLDEPSDPLSVCLYNLAELTRRHVKVVLGGDGGDELFGGYDRYYGNILANYYALLPRTVREKMIGPLLRVMPEGFWYRSLSHRLRWMHQMSFAEGGDRYAKSLSYFYFSDGFRERLFSEQFLKSMAAFDPEAAIKVYFDSDNAKEVVDKMLYADSMTRMPDHPNMILDRMSMAHGLEVRSPFLDHKLAEFCATIPFQYKVRGTKRRYIEMALAGKYLPPALLEKRKQGFSSALTYLLAEEFKRLYKLLLDDASLVRDGFLNPVTLKSLLSEHLNRKVDHGNRLWLLCNAEVWYRMFIENWSIDKFNERLESVNTDDVR